MRVLVVEDEERFAAGLRDGLEAEGFAVDVALDGLWMARENAYDAIVLDIMLPRLNGYRVCRALRGEGDWTPILMLTAKEGEWDEIEGLDTGADDYLTKPARTPCCSPGCGRCCAARRARGPPCSRWATCGWTRPRAP